MKVAPGKTDRCSLHPPWSDWPNWSFFYPSHLISHISSTFLHVRLQVFVWTFYKIIKYLLWGSLKNGWPHWPQQAMDKWSFKKCIFPPITTFNFLIQWSHYSYRSEKASLTHDDGIYTNPGSVVQWVVSQWGHIHLCYQGAEKWNM